MKKAIASTLLAALIVRLAVLAGAGEALGAWVREIGVDERMVAAALNMELGSAPEQTAGEETEAEDGPEAPEPTTQLMVVTPRARSEEAESRGETTEAAAVETVGTTLSGASAVHNRAGVDIDIDALAAEGLELRLAAGQPQVLIIHTHSSEAYTQDEYDQYEPSDPYRTEDKSRSVIRVGDVLTERFEAAGLTVLHDRELYDYPSYTGSYSRSGAAVEQYLADYPSIQIVIDLHRDAIGSGDVVYKTQAALSGKDSAQVMLLVGTGQNGLWHPLWKENLKLALYMQNAMDDRWPTLARPIELVGERYNQHLSTGFVLLEVGSTGNTLREAEEAVALLGDSVGPALAKLIE